MILTLFTAALATGCVSVKKSYPEKRYYLLEANRPGEKINPGGAATLQLRPMRISPAFDEMGFIYRTGSSQYESDFYHEFFISPGAIIHEQTRQWLADSGLFRHVVSAASHLQPQYLLEGSIVALYGDYAGPNGPKAVIEIQFLLLRDVLGDLDIVFQMDYRRETPIPHPTPEGLVQAWNTALVQILSAFEDDVRKAHLMAESP